MSREATNPSDPLMRLQDWYANECNGDWEHSFGVKIDTLDNPGWTLDIDLRETEWENLGLPRHVEERTENDWIQYEVADQKFQACGGPGNLGELISLFFSQVVDRS